MAGKFLTLDEAAAALGISTDDVQKLVDRKELFPIRDGGALKFRSEEIDQRKQDSGEAASWEQTAGTDDGLSVDLDLDEPLALDGLDLDAKSDSAPAIDLQGEAIELADDLALSGGDSLLGGSGDDLDSIIASNAAGGDDATPPPARRSTSRRSPS